MKFYIYEDKHRLGQRQPCTLRWVEADTAEAAIIAWMAQQPRADWRPTSALVIPEDRNFGRPHFEEDPNDRFYAYADPTVDAEEICAESYMVGNCMEFYGFQLCGMGWVKSESSVSASLWKHPVHGWCWQLGYRQGEANARFTGGTVFGGYQNSYRSSVAALADMQKRVVEAYNSNMATMAATRMKPLVHLTAALCITRKDRAQSWIPAVDGHVWTCPVQGGEQEETSIFYNGKDWCWTSRPLVAAADGPTLAQCEGYPNILEAEGAWRRHQNSRSTKTMPEMDAEMRAEARGGLSVTPMPQSAVSPSVLAGVLPTQWGGRPPQWKVRPPEPAEAPPGPLATSADDSPEDQDDEDEDEDATTERCEGCPDKPAVAHDEHMIPLCGDCYDLLGSDSSEEEEQDGKAGPGTEKDAAPTTPQ